jgi:alpha-glucosidase
MLLLTLRGTPTCYYGDELGMPDSDIPDEVALDPQIETGRSRDGARTPMQWYAGAGAGFTSASSTPWLPVDPSYATINVAAQETDPRSSLAFFRRLTHLRRERAELTVGSISFVDSHHEDVLSYLREWEGSRILVVLNFGEQTATVDLTEVSTGGLILCATDMTREGLVELAGMAIQPGQGLVIDIRD